MLKNYYGVNPVWFNITRDQKWETIVGQHEQFAIVEEDDILYIFFQETKGVEDWLSNFNFFRDTGRAYSSMRRPWYMHRGFRQAWQKMELTVLHAMRSYYLRCYGSPKIRIQGYSRGAALAQICHEAIKYETKDLNYPPNIETIAFAPPRWLHVYGSWNVRKRMQGVKLVIDPNDIVTHAPPCLTGYTHIGEKIFLDKRRTFFPSTEAHRPENYVILLREYDRKQSLKALEERKHASI